MRHGGPAIPDKDDADSDSEDQVLGREDIKSKAKKRIEKDLKRKQKRNSEAKIKKGVAESSVRREKVPSFARSRGSTSRSKPATQEMAVNRIIRP